MGYDADARAAGALVREILSRRKPHIWAHLIEEPAFVYWAACWAFHWAGKHLVDVSER